METMAVMGALLLCQRGRHQRFAGWYSYRALAGRGESPAGAQDLTVAGGLCPAIILVPLIR